MATRKYKLVTGCTDDRTQTRHVIIRLCVPEGLRYTLLSPLIALFARPHYSPIVAGRASTLAQVCRQIRQQHRGSTFFRPHATFFSCTDPEIIIIIIMSSRCLASRKAESRREAFPFLSPLDTNGASCERTDVKLARKQLQALWFMQERHGLD